MLAECASSSYALLAHVKFWQFFSLSDFTHSTHRISAAGFCHHHTLSNSGTIDWVHWLHQEASTSKIGLTFSSLAASFPSGSSSSFLNTACAPVP